MPHLESLKSASTLTDFADLVGYHPSALSFLLYKLPENQKYTRFEIPKKAGGTRVIDAPEKRLKALQKKLADILYGCRAELDEKYRKLSKSKRAITPASHGFRKGYSIVTNARQHRAQRYVLNLDIKDFFPSLNFGRVRGFFLKNGNFELHERIATIIAQIACYQNSLPQGSPCSPIISDFVAQALDARLVQLAQNNFCTYSRYVDDLTFSTNLTEFPKAVAHQIDEKDASWVLSEGLLAVISRAGFSINGKKTRMQYRMSRQVVTGLTVNRKVNIRADYYRQTRAMCHSLFSSGTFHRDVASKTQDNAGAVTSNAPTQPQLEGRLSHVYYVKELEKKRSRQNEKIPGDKKQKPTGIDKLYDRFLFFKYFVNLEKPLVLCEGKTDSIYLKTAIHKLPVYRGRLTVPDQDNLRTVVNFFRYTNLAHRVLHLYGGTDPLKNLILRYEAMMAYYKYAPMLHPVIMLIDNDDGAKDIFSVLRKSYFTIDPKTDAPFYHIARNLYLVKTPSMGEDGLSSIEDLFEQSVLDTELDGKKFNRDKEHESSGEYGKAIFAERVVIPKSDQIDFSKFAALLDRVIATVDHYKLTVFPALSR